MNELIIVRGIRAENGIIKSTKILKWHESRENVLMILKDYLKDWHIVKDIVKVELNNHPVLINSREDFENLIEELEN